LLATLSTLFFVPTFFSLVHSKDGETKTVNLDD